MAYNTSKKCFFCNENTLTGKRIGRKTVCISCMSDLSEALNLTGRHKNEDD